MRKKLAKRLDLFPLFFFAALIFVFFWQFFLKRLLPIPADITVGLYFPWLDYQWGFPVGVPVKNPLLSDIPSLVYPWRALVIDHLKKGILPLWNPYYLGGMPLLANFQSAVFSLSNLFFVFLPSAIAWSAGVIIQPFLTGLFTFWFLRHLKLSNLASLLGGIVFAFGGFSTMWLEYNIHGHAMMWLPILLLLIDKIIATKKLKWVLLGSLVLAVQIFAGYPQIVLYSLTAAAFYTLFFRRSLSWRVALFVVLGILLASVQLLPGQEALRLSVRYIDPIAQSSSGGFLPWKNLVTFFAPDFFGNPATYNFWGSPWYDNFALYVGILPLLLSGMAIFLRRDRQGRFFAFLALISLLLALPTPLAKIVAASGIFGVKAISARIIILLDFALGILAALGLDWLLKKKPVSVFSLAKIITPCFIFVGTTWTFVLLAKRLFPTTDWLTDLPVTKRNLILPTVLFLASSGLLFGFSFLRRWRFLLKIGVIFLVVFDLFRFGFKYLPFSKPELVFPTTPVIEFLQSREKPFRVEFGEAIPQNMWLPYGFESAAGYDALAPLRFNQFLGALRTGQADTPYGRVAQVENYQSPLFDLLNIKYVMAVKYDEKGIRRPEGKPKPIFEEEKFQLAFEDKTTQVYENLKVLPRAFLVHNYQLETNDQEIINQLLSMDFDLSKSVVLEEKISLTKMESSSCQEAVSYLRYSSYESIMKTFSGAEGILVLTDSFYPGWKAFIDGQETQIYRANFAFRAVKVPAGEHQVRFIYDPRSFKIGLSLSLGALAVLIVGGLVVYRFKKEWW